MERSTFKTALALLIIAACGPAASRTADVRDHILEPSSSQLAALRQHAGSGTEPFVMMNLLEFRGDEGRAVYFQRYAAPARELIHAGGGEVVWAGAVQQAFVDTTAGEWDQLILVRWPSRKAFLDVMVSPAYAQLTEARNAGLERTMMLVMDDNVPAPSR